MSDSRAIGRLETISRHLHAPSHFASRSAADVVVLSVARTPIGKAKRGAFKDTPPDILLAAALRGALERAGVRGEDLGDIRVGNVLPANGAIFARMAQFEAGIPYTVPLATVNRQCSSGLQAIADVAAMIKAGHIELGIASGVESMSSTAMGEAVPPFSQQAVFACPLAADCLVPMGMTSENVAEHYGITREQQDSFAARSHALAAQAQREGRFQAEIVPVTLEDGTVVSADEGIREGTTVQGLAKLRCGTAARPRACRPRRARRFSRHDRTCSLRSLASAAPTLSPAPSTLPSRPQTGLQGGRLHDRRQQQPGERRSGGRRARVATRGGAARPLLSHHGGLPRVRRRGRAPRRDGHRPRVRDPRRSGQGEPLDRRRRHV
jgi:hypothetical protein